MNTAEAWGCDNACMLRKAGDAAALPAVHAISLRLVASSTDDNAADGSKMELLMLNMIETYH